MLECEKKKKNKVHVQVDETGGPGRAEREALAQLREAAGGSADPGPTSASQRPGLQGGSGRYAASPSGVPRALVPPPAWQPGVVGRGRRAPAATAPPRARVAAARLAGLTLRSSSVARPQLTESPSCVGLCFHLGNGPMRPGAGAVVEH